MRKQLLHCMMGLAILASVKTLANDPVKSKKIKHPAPEEINAGLKLPAGFAAIKVAENLGRTRHLVVTPQGDIYTKIMGKVLAGKGILQLHDPKGDGKAYEITSFGNYGGTGIAIKNGYLYASSDEEVSAIN